MSDDPSIRTRQQVPSDAAPDPQFMKKFEEVIGAFAEATSAGNTEDAQEAAMQALIMAAEESLRNPTPELLLQNEADELESKGNWTEAEAVRRKVLALEEASGNFAKISNAQMALCSVLRLVGCGDEAWQFACAATVSARRAKISLLVVMALLREAYCALERGDSAKAFAAAAEAVQIVEPGKLFDHMRARALTARAKCLLARGDTAGAELDLASAGDLLQEKAGSQMMQGIIWTVANWWEVKSQLEERLENLYFAREAITKAIEHYRQCGGPHTLLALARALTKLGEISREAGDFAVEEQSLGEAKAIREGLNLPAAAL